MSARLRLYGFFRSSAAWRVRIALNLKGLAFETVPVNLRAGEHRGPAYRALNPGALVPALEIDGAVLGQSLAILEYLDERFPEPSLLSSNPLGRARVRAVALQIACEIHPLNNLRALKFVKSDLGLGEEVAHGRWYRHWIADGLQAVEAMIEGPDTCFPGAISLADVALVPQVANARRFHCDLSAFPKVAAVDAALARHPAFAAALPEHQPDAALYEVGAAA